MFKRALSLIICIIMLTSTFAGTGLTLSANTAETVIPAARPAVSASMNEGVVTPDRATASYSGTCGDNLTWSLNTSTGVLNITGTGEMYDDYYASSYNGSYRTTAPWKYYISSIKSVVIGDSVTSIGSYAFYYCDSLKSVTIGNSVTSIGYMAFAYCTSLTSVTIPDSVTSIGGSAFFNTAYYNNSSNWENNVLYIGNHLIKAKSYVSGDYSIIDGTLTIADGALSYCDSLTSVNIPDSVTSISDQAFHYCTSLKSVTIGNSVTSIGNYAFESCDSLKSVTIGNSVTSIGRSAFEDCDSLTSVNIGNSVTSIGEDAFKYCTSLTSVNIPDSVTSIGYEAFRGCISLKSVNIPDSVTSIGDDAFSNTAYYNNSSKWENNVLYIGNHLIKAKSSVSGDYSIKDGTLTIAGSAFEYCTSLTNVTIPDSVTSIGDRAFHYYSVGLYYKLNVTIKCCENSYAHTYAKNEGFKYELMHKCVFTNYIPDNNATCTEDGTKTAYCDLGCGMTNTITDEGTALGHSFTEYVDYEAATCTTDATRISYCDLGCGKTHTITDVGSALGHVFTVYVSDDNFTCTEDGTKTANCDNGCGATDTIVDEGSAAHRYTREEILREPTCLKGGYKLLLCDCGVSKSATIDKVDHIYTVYTYNNDATCTDDGTETASCDFGCGNTDIRTAAGTMIEHLFTVYNYNGDATCTSDGTKTAYCDYGCGNTDTLTAVATMLDHSYGSSVTLEPTCSAEGIRTYVCTGCSKTYSEPVAMIPHVYVSSVTKEPTCTKEGVLSYTCTGCNDSYTESIAMIPHVYVSSVTKEPTCTKEGVLTYTCTACGDNYTEVIAKLPHSYTEEILDEPTCSTEGFAVYTCKCGDFYTADLSKTDHTWGEWVTSDGPTPESKGKEARICTVCSAAEFRELDKYPQPELSVNNYTLTLTLADYVKDVRYAPGVYTTTTEIRNAEGNVALSGSIIKENTVDGNFVYDMPDGGIYSMWVRMTDGTNYILPVDMTKFTPAVDTYGVKVTVNGLYDIKDFFIAKGEFNTYNEIKNNGFIVRLTANKIAGKHSYTYTVSEPGMHTVLVRYNNGSEHIFHENLVVDEPVFTTNGLQVTVSNLPDVKVIRTAYGEWNTVKELKATDTIRNFSAKTAIKGRDPYTIQYREDGMVTIIVEYNNGYQKVFHYNVQHKKSNCTVTGDTVLLRDLDGLVMIRYAMGEYATSAEIKRAKGSKYLKPADLTNGYAIVSGLTKGIYTFCVQYDDESYNYFTVTVK